jgi:hypothetical protein
MRAVIVLVLVVAAPVAAQTRIEAVRESPFAAGTSRVYDDQWQLVGTARENAFDPGRVDLYDRTGRPTGVEVRDNAFDPDRRDILDDCDPDRQ